MHDRPADRRRLALRAPAAFPQWKRRIARLDARRPGPEADPSAMLVVSSDRRRGAEVFAEQLVVRLGDRGWRTELVSLTTADPEEASVAARPVSARRPDALGKLDLEVVMGLRREIRRSSPDLVFANGGATLRYTAAALATLRRRPTFVYGSIGEPDYWTRGRLHRSLTGFLLRRADFVIAVAEATRRQLEAFGISRHRSAVAHTGVPEALLSLRRSAPEPGLRILFLGSLSPEKGPETAVEVLHRLGAEVEAVLCMVGGGMLEEPLRQRVAALGLADRVSFPGPVEDVRPHLEWADVLLLTSETEGLPGVVLEAAAAGVPTVAFAVGGTGETVIDGETGWLVPPGDMDGLVDLLRRLAEDPGRRSRSGERAREMVRDGFLLDQAVDRYEAILRGCVGSLSGERARR